MQTEKFEGLAISPELRRAVQHVGFEAMTPIQAKAIPMLLQGKDVIGGAQSNIGLVREPAILEVKRMDHFFAGAAAEQAGAVAPRQDR